MHDFEFSNAQALGGLTSTGIVSDNVFDMELSKNGGDTILTNDQLVGCLNINLSSNDDQVGGASGLWVCLRSCDNDDMTTTPVELGRAFISEAELKSGCVKNIEVTKSLTQKFVGLFYDPESETITTGNTVDAHWSIAPLTKNGTLQKLASR